MCVCVCVCAYSFLYLFFRLKDGNELHGEFREGKIHGGGKCIFTDGAGVTCVSMYVCVCVCVCVYIYIYIYI